MYVRRVSLCIGLASFAISGSRRVEKFGESDTPNEQSPTVIMKGDTQVLQRLEKQDRKAARASRLLIRKLSRKRKKKACHSITLRRTSHGLSFASGANFAKHAEMAVALRRLVKARDEEGYRAFFVEELGNDADEPVTLIVSPKSAAASADLVAQRVTKVPHSVSKLSSSKVCLLESADDAQASCGDKLSFKAVFLQKLHIHNGITVFYATTSNNPVCAAMGSPPWSLGLDRHTYHVIQDKLARMLGAQLLSV